jgi:uncharacterized membrane protein
LSNSEIVILFEIILRLLVLLFLYHISTQLKELSRSNKVEDQNNFFRKFYLPAIILLIIVSLFIVLGIPKAFIGN